MRYDTADAPLDRTLIAIAHPIRRRIVERVAAGELRVTDVAAEFPISLNSVSKHVRLLERAGLLERRVAGREHLLRARLDPLVAARDWIAAQERFWANRLAALDRLLTAQDAASRPRPRNTGSASRAAATAAPRPRKKGTSR